MPVHVAGQSYTCLCHIVKPGSVAGIAACITETLLRQSVMQGVGSILEPHFLDSVWPD